MASEVASLARSREAKGGNWQREAAMAAHPAAQDSPMDERIWRLLSALSSINAAIRVLEAEVNVMMEEANDD